MLMQKLFSLGIIFIRKLPGLKGYNRATHTKFKEVEILQPRQKHQTLSKS